MLMYKHRFKISKSDTSIHLTHVLYIDMISISKLVNNNINIIDHESYSKTLTDTSKEKQMI